MKNSNKFTCNINKTLMKELSDYSIRSKTPKNKIIENALIKYFDELRRAEYVRSFQKEKNDPEILVLAEEGLDDFLRIIERYE